MATTTKAPERATMGRVLMVGGNYEYVRLFHSLGFTGTSDINEADVVLFTGGEDVDPNLYGEMKLAATHCNRARDDFELKVYDAAQQRKIPMVGICRGGQFLNVCNGGTLWQDVNKHTANHPARVNKEACPWFRTDAAYGNSKEIWVTSTHHQMMRPHKEGIVLLTAYESTERHAAGQLSEGKANEKEPDIEAVWYPDTLSLCFQPHPEFTRAPPSCVQFFGKCIDNLILEAMPLPENLREILSKGVKK